MNTICIDTCLDNRFHKSESEYYSDVDTSDSEVVEEWNALVGKFDGTDEIRTEADVNALLEIANYAIEYGDFDEYTLNQFREGIDEANEWRKDANAIPSVIVTD